VLSTSASLLQASYTYPLEIFTNNGSFCNSSDLNLYVEVSNGKAEQVDFTFHNKSLIDSSIARIYFDDDLVLSDLLLNIVDITGGPGTSFSQPATPGNLPGGNLLVPQFVATEEFSFDGDPPVFHNGINPGEQLQITFNINGGTVAAVIDGLNTNTIRVGTHVIALPDGSSESAVVTPEPATVALLGLGSLSLLCRRRRA